MCKMIGEIQGMLSDSIEKSINQSVKILWIISSE